MQICYGFGPSGFAFGSLIVGLFFSERLLRLLLWKEEERDVIIWKRQKYLGVLGAHPNTAVCRAVICMSLLELLLKRAGVSPCPVRSPDTLRSTGGLGEPGVFTT